MEFRLVSTRDRLPELWTTYFILIDGRTDIVTMPWIRKRVERYPENEFHWLEDTRAIASTNTRSLDCKGHGFAFTHDRPWERF